MKNLIGLTGGIGSGKSTVAKIFMTLGVPVYDSDARAKILMSHDEKLRQQIIDLLGSEAYAADQSLNRSWIASQVFSEPSRLEKLNSIVHPAVFNDLQAWASEEKQKKSDYIIQESAILFEENLTSRLEAIILVVAEEETRIARVMERENVSREHVVERMLYQWPDQKKLPYSDFVIFNDSGRSLISQVSDIDKMIRSRITGG
jgi:dephospho-CoA kinase